MFPTNNIPRNVEFSQYNLLSGLSYPDNTFDFVHQRLLCPVFPQKQWESLVIPELTRITKPGGWIEFVEADDFIKTKGPTTQRVKDAGKQWLLKPCTSISFPYFDINLTSQ